MKHTEEQIKITLYLAIQTLQLFSRQLQIGSFHPCHRLRDKFNSFHATGCQKKSIRRAATHSRTWSDMDNKMLLSYSRKKNHFHFGWNGDEVGKKRSPWLCLSVSLKRCCWCFMNNLNEYRSRLGVQNILPKYSHRCNYYLLLKWSFLSHSHPLKSHINPVPGQQQKRHPRWGENYWPGNSVRKNSWFLFIFPARFYGLHFQSFPVRPPRRQSTDTTLWQCYCAY